MIEPLVDKIIVEIATNYPFSIDDIKETYYLCGSIDKTILMCEWACRFGYSSSAIAFKALMGKYSFKESI